MDVGCAVGSVLPAAKRPRIVRKNEVLIPGNFSLLSHFLAAIMAEQWDKILSLAQKNDGAGIKAILNA